MIFGTVRVTDSVVETHRDSYMLGSLTGISVRRPLLPGGLLFAGGGAGFGLTFADLLYPSEICAVSALSLADVALGFGIGQIQLLSRDLRGSELACMIWGTYGHLNRIRRDIGEALSSRKGKGHGAEKP